jgi:hypothetical protein
MDSNSPLGLPLHDHTNAGLRISRLNEGIVRAAVSLEGICCGAMRSNSAKAPRKPCRASVETALALDEITQRLIQVLEFCRVPQHP